jgi:hypothetical protein
MAAKLVGNIDIKIYRKKILDKIEIIIILYNDV